ncbi:MAG: tRNA (adenosine(37)-N6)-threonylcarbamoyltransferase complex transferase subunit TsaD [Candidatus Margulisiibacteriota bacterium]
MNILAIETSCDETSAAVVKDGTKILSSIISSQNDFHAKYGGIVPEVAARKHIEAISPVIKEAIDRAGIKFKDIDAVATTFGPGLPGSLIVGLSAAKAISFALKKPLIGVNHLEGHIYANFLNSPPSGSPLSSKERGDGEVSFPFICLIVSGGHTQLVKVNGHMEFETLGRTRDDAAGEAYDKVARFLGLGYPGGPIIDKLAKEGNENAVNFKRPMLEEEYKYDFSFSGIKTAVVYYVKKNPPSPLGRGAGGEGGVRVLDIAASFQKSVVDTLVEKTIKAAEENSIKTVAIGGGVAANSKLRADMKVACDNKGIKCILPPLELCTDNAAMIGCAGYFRYKKRMVADYSLAIESTARI